MNSLRFRAALAASAAGFAMLSFPAYAQETQPKEDDVDTAEGQAGFGDIVVTARRTEERLQSIPVAVSVANAEKIAELQLQTVTDVQRVAPGLISRGAGTGPTAIVTFALRGNAQNSPNSVSDPAVGIYLDGVYLARPIASNMGFLDVESIEVLRGTQGTLFGRNTTGGAVSFTTVQPDGELSGYVRGEVGNYDHRMVEAAATLPIVGDELSVRLAGRYIERDGFGENVFTGAPLGDIDSDVSLRATVRIAPESLPVSLTLSGEYLDSSDNGTMNALRAVNPAGPLATIFPGQFSPTQIQNGDNFYDSFAVYDGFIPSLRAPRNYNEAYGFTGTLTVDLDSVQIKSITAYRDSNSGNTLDLDSTPAGGITFDSQYEQNQFSQELQISGESGRLQWIFGGFFFEESGRERSDSRVLYGSPVIPGRLSLAPSGRNLTDFDSQSIAVFAQGNYRITDDLRLTAGLRYTWDERNILGRGVNNITGSPETILAGGRAIVIQPNTCRVGPNSNTTPPTPCEAPVSASFSYPAWTLSLDYQVTPDVLVYAKTGGASLSGGFNTRPTPAGLEAFSPEDVRDVEAGFKGEFFDSTLQTNIAVFHAWRNGAQNIVNGIVNGGISQYAQNSGNIRTYGVEFEGRALPWEGMELSGSVSRLWSSYADGTFLDVGTNGVVDRSAEEVAQVPAWTLNFGATQTFVTNFGELSLHADYVFTDEFNFGQETADLTNPALTQAQRDAAVALVNTANALGTLPSYNLVNARATIKFDDPNIELAIWGRNIFGEQYNQNLFNSYRQLGFVAVNPAPPATYGVTVSLQW